MKRLIPALLLLAAACAPRGGGAAAMGGAPTGDITVYRSTGEVPWKDAADLAAGAKSCIQYGDPARGPHMFRLSFPGGVVRPPHYHSSDECVTVLSGTLYIGQGEVVDQSREVGIQAGGYFVIPAKVPHWVSTRAEATFLVYVNGPRDVVLVDPRRK